MCQAKPRRHATQQSSMACPASIVPRKSIEKGGICGSSYSISNAIFYLLKGTISRNPQHNYLLAWEAHSDLNVLNGSPRGGLCRSVLHITQCNSFHFLFHYPPYNLNITLIFEQKRCCTRHAVCICLLPRPAASMLVQSARAHFKM